MEEKICLFCRQEIKKTWGSYSQSNEWRHMDGYRECRTTYATPIPDWLTGGN